MTTYRQLIYMVLDELKLFSDDSTYTEEHVAFLLNKYRVFLLKQRYSDIKKPIPESNYQTIHLNLIEVPAIPDNPCEDCTYLRSKDKVPFLMKIHCPIVYPVDYYGGEITLVSKERMRYVGHNKYLQNIIYASLGPDNYLYFKSSNPQHKYLEKVGMQGIFEHPEEALELSNYCGCKKEVCDILDIEFPLEEGLIAPLIELTVKELLGAIYRPKDSENNANDELSTMATQQPKNRQ